MRDFRPAYYTLFGLILISVLSVLVNTFISSLHPHPEDKVHPVTEVVVVADGVERGGDGSEVPPMARLVSSTPVKASSVAPFRSDASQAGASESSSPYASSPPAQYQTPTAAQQSLNSRSSDSRR